MEVLRSQNLEIKKVLILSPTGERLIYENEFPDLEFYSANEIDWDLNFRNPNKYDLIIAHNVFHYSNNPNLWLDNVMSSCKFFLMQDLLTRKRGVNSEFCNDGDKQRYSFGDIKYFSGETFNLKNITKYSIKKFKEYSGENNSLNKGARHFICLFENENN